MVVEIEELVRHEPVGTQLEILAPSMSGVSDTTVRSGAARAGTPAVLVVPPTAPCETWRKKGMLDPTSEMLGEDETPEAAVVSGAGIGVFVFGRSCRASFRRARDRAVYGRVWRGGSGYSIERE